MGRVWGIAGVVAALSGCAAFSAAHYATSRCVGCEGVKEVVAGDPIEIEYSWPESKERATRAITPRVRCVGASCDVAEPKLSLHESDKESQGAYGAAKVSVTPKGAGELTITASLADAEGAQDWAYGPFRVIDPDRLELACTASDPQTGTKRGCSEAAVGDVIRVDIRAWSGNLQVTPRLFGVLSVDGKAVPGAEWGCARSEKDPAVTSCASGSQVFSPGRHTLNVTRGALSADLQIFFK